jgi:hypothetical protein
LPTDIQSKTASTSKEPFKGPIRIPNLVEGLPLKRVYLVCIPLIITTDVGEPIESFVAPDEMAMQFAQAAKGEGVDLERDAGGVILLEAAMKAFEKDGELKVQKWVFGR